MPATNTTTNFKFNLTDFDKIPWGEEAHNNWHIVDALMARFIAISLVQGAWENALAVTIGNRYIDTDEDNIYEVLISHTTPSTGTFAASRLAVPSYWQSVTVEVANKGTYTQGTAFNANDFIVDGGRFGIVVAQFTSDATQATAALSYDLDVTGGDIITLLDASSLIDATHDTNIVGAGGTPTATYTGSTRKFNFGLVTGATGATGPTGASGASNIVLDTTPQLGGDLDLNGNDITGFVIGTNIQAFDADTLKADTADTLTKGFNATENDAGTKSSGTFTPDPADGNFQKAVNGGAHTLAPPATTTSIVIQYTNDGSAGTITTSGFTIVDGDTISTTNGDDFLFYIVRDNGFSHLRVVALQ